MISVKEAQTLVERNSKPLGTAAVAISESLGYVLAENVRSPFPMPLFTNSAMDGFVLRSADTRYASLQNPMTLRIRGTIQAGDDPKCIVRHCEAWAVMTGAVIPKGADTVLVKEKAIIEKNHLIVRESVKKWQHIRFQGEELKKGARVLRRYSAMDAAKVGVLASIGRKSVQVFRKPSVAIIATGNELVWPGEPLRRGQIYDSSSFLIASALRQIGIEPVSVETVTDEREALKRALKRALARAHVVILTGGVSVGDYDFVKQVVRDLHVRSIFWKVSQKPGKPIYFGRRGRTLVFGLPGNPASVFTCFYQYVYLALRRLSGVSGPALRRTVLPLEAAVEPDPTKVLFLKGKTHAGGVIPLGRQGSHMISSLCETDGFIVIPAGRRILRKGTQVSVDLVPHARNGDL